MTHKTWLITGAGRGLGAQLAQTVLAAGDNVVVTARDSEAARAAFTAHTDRLSIYVPFMARPSLQLKVSALTWRAI
ncbi:SDR family NAD(P)-dependent oxidoreductase [Sodalis glossinidius]|uniref:SDR family NAD(P)-dependent oxidoreductase n=1 Tax=Sodalis glossinidius TaxID=63612 RepID=UPI0002EA95AB|nr:SDR family NAD(P)-dependent oxidoreductase [Sodalis glossinidius]